MNKKPVFLIFIILILFLTCSKKTITSPENVSNNSDTFTYTPTNISTNTYTFTYTHTYTPTFTPTPYGKIVYSSNMDGDYDVYIYNISLQTNVNITNNNSSNTKYDGYPAWLYNGTQIYFVSDRSIGFGMDIYVTNDDGSSQFEKVGTSADKYYPRPGIFGTNKHLFYHKYNSTSGKYEICAWDNINSKEVVVLASSQGDYQWCDYNTYANKIVYASTTTGYKQIYIANTDGSNSVMLTSNAYLHTQPKFSKYGTKIVYSADSNYDDKGEIWIMNTDGSGKTRLTYNNENDRLPCFSPDGYWILYVKYDSTNTNGDLYLTTINGGQEIKLNLGFSNTNENCPDWYLY